MMTLQQHEQRGALESFRDERSYLSARCMFSPTPGRNNPFIKSLPKSKRAAVKKLMQVERSDFK
jgi:hypothetical protein